MARIYRLTDRVKYKIGEVEIQISPLSLEAKSQLHAYMSKAQDKDMDSALKASAHAIKVAVKSISGLEKADGTPYELEFEADGRQLTDDCVNDLMNLSESPQMITLCSMLIAGIPQSLPTGISLVEDDSRPNAVKSKKSQSKSSGST